MAGWEEKWVVMSAEERAGGALGWVVGEEDGGRGVAGVWEGGGLADGRI